MNKTPSNTVLPEPALPFFSKSFCFSLLSLVALLMAAYQGRRLEEVRMIDIAKMIKEIGMDQHLSANRRSGFYSMVERLNAVVG